MEPEAENVQARLAALEGALGGVPEITRERSASIGELVKALCLARLAFGEVVKDRTATIPGKDGKRGYEYAYATLDSALRATTASLAEQGLVVFHAYSQAEGRVTVTCRLTHSSDQFISNSLTLEAPRGIGAQVLGGLLTYLRRYTYFGLLGLAPTDDDDGDHVQRLADRPRAEAGHGEATPDDVARLAAADPGAAFAAVRQQVAEVAGCGAISEARLRRLYTLAEKERGWREAQVEAACGQLLGVAAAHLPWKAYEAVVELFCRVPPGLAGLGAPAPGQPEPRPAAATAPAEAALLPSWREAWDKISADFRGLPQESPRIAIANVDALLQGLTRHGWAESDVRTVLRAELGTEPANLPPAGPVLLKVQKAFRVYVRADVGAEDRQRYGWEPMRHEEEPPFGDDPPLGSAGGFSQVMADSMESLGRISAAQLPDTADEAWQAIRAALDGIGQAQPDLLEPMTPDDRLDLFRPANNGGRKTGDVDGLCKHHLGLRVEKLPALAYAAVKRVLQAFPPSGPGKEEVLGRLPAPGEQLKASELLPIVQRLQEDGIIKEDEVRRSGGGGKVTREDLQQAVDMIRERALMEAGKGHAS